MGWLYLNCVEVRTHPNSWAAEVSLRRPSAATVAAQMLAFWGGVHTVWG